MYRPTRLHLRRYRDEMSVALPSASFRAVRNHGKLSSGDHSAGFTRQGLPSFSSSSNNRVRATFVWNVAL